MTDTARLADEMAATSANARRYAAYLKAAYRASHHQGAAPEPIQATSVRRPSSHLSLPGTRRQRFLAIRQAR